MKKEDVNLKEVLEKAESVDLKELEELEDMIAPACGCGCGGLC